METLTWLFGCSLFVIFYSYFGYGFLLGVLSLFKKDPVHDELFFDEDWPEVALVITAYNEQDVIEDKIINSFNLDYPKDKLHIYFVTDGSTDDSGKIIAEYPEITHFHQTERKGKLSAIGRVMSEIPEPITIYTEANASLSKEAIREMIKHFDNNLVGAVAGEKTIIRNKLSDKLSSGEGLYWRYESQLKKWDYRLHSVVGATGELFAIRTLLYEKPKSDTLIEDFVMTLGIAEKGYRVAYEPKAKAFENSSDDLHHDMKCKVHVSAGGLQAIWRKRALLNPFRYGILSFQYISHRVLRWTLAPLALVILFIANLFLAKVGDAFFFWFFVAQVVFYAMATLGYYLDSVRIRLKGLLIPLYFTFMNLSVYLGFIKLISGNQAVILDKSKKQ